MHGTAKKNNIRYWIVFSNYMIRYKWLGTLQSEAQCLSSGRDIYMVSVGDVENSYALQQWEYA
jgi:hypothetical protein